ncbi:MAG TPA: DUF1003 domain-containing protein [Dermatophilaceae bacterium]|nr:DUF1003 domain-containing protein [Dermatophilaceae bacterium]
MADLSRGERGDRLDQPREYSRRFELPSTRMDQEAFGRFSERIARFMGTAKFLIYMTGFVIAWLLWNLISSGGLRFDEYPFIFLTLMLSLQASYAAPLILLAQNRQDDRDRVAFEQDRARDERNLADTEYLTREVAALRVAMRDMATRDYLRSELRDLLDELDQRAASQSWAGAGLGGAGAVAGAATSGTRGSGSGKKRKSRPAAPDQTALPDEGPADLERAPD